MDVIIGLLVFVLCYYDIRTTTYTRHNDDRHILGQCWANVVDGGLALPLKPPPKKKITHLKLSRYRDTQLRVGENYLIFHNLNKEKCQSNNCNVHFSFTFSG